MAIRGGSKRQAGYGGQNRSAAGVMRIVSQPREVTCPH